MTDPILILDNGASTIKVGWAHEDELELIPNGIFRSKRDKRVYIADQLRDECQDFGGLIYKLPFERGILTNWDIQKPVWDRVFSRFQVEPSASSLLLTEPLFNLPNVGQYYDQIVFEEYDFLSYTRCPGASFIPYGTLPASEQDVDGPYDEGTLPECVLVIETGFSFTHIIPVQCGEIIWPAVQRIDIGGKLLTNYLKELVSFRQWNVMDDTHVLNTAKEACCFVSQDFNTDQELAKQTKDIVQQFVLPDFSPRSQNKFGYIKGQEPPELQDQNPSSDDQVLKMNSERFVVPELLFQPPIIGMKQSGIAHAVAASISKLPEELQGLFWANITLIGGNANLPGFQSRLLKDLRTLASSDFIVSVRLPEDPVTWSFECIKEHLSLDELPFRNATSIRQHFVTRQEYQEHGSNICRRKFKSAPLSSDWVAPAAVLREGDVDDSTDTVSSGHSVEMARKRARRAALDQQALGDKRRIKKGKEDRDAQAFKASGKPKK